MVAPNPAASAFGGRLTEHTLTAGVRPPYDGRRTKRWATNDRMTGVTMNEKQTQRVFNILSVVIIALLVFDFAWVMRAALDAAR
jgi:hypothetical protein